MIKYISSWAEQIIIAVIIVTIIEMILPKGNSKKYIKTILGVYILYTIITPAIKLVTGNDIKIDYSDYEKYFNAQEMSSEIEVPTLEDTYKTEIEKQIKSDVEKLGYSAYNVKTDIDLNEGIIKKISLDISKEKRDENSISISVNKIDIGNSVKEDNRDTKETKEIKQNLSENYGVDYKNITVNSKWIGGKLYV